MCVCVCVCVCARVCVCAILSLYTIGLLFCIYYSLIIQELPQYEYIWCLAGKEGERRETKEGKREKYSRVRVCNQNKTSNKENATEPGIYFINSSNRPL